MTARQRVSFMIAAFVVALLPLAHAQQAPQGQAPAPTPQARGPIDLTGNWVSVVTEDWRWRMSTPQKGDVASLPVTGAARKEAEAWDLAADVAQGNACRPFGAGGIMRMPGRLRISWQDPATLKIEADAGTQTRLLHFDRAKLPSGPRSWQGASFAEWELVGGGGRGGGGGRAGGPPPAGSLKVVTTRLRKGYVRKNGIPYSENAVITEYFDRHTARNGDEWFTVTTVIDDPVYFNGPLITSTDFKKEANGSRWNPTPCVIDPPPTVRASQ